MTDCNEIKRKGNNYDLLLVFIIALQIFGIIGDAFQPVKLFVVAITPFVMYLFSENRFVAKKYLYEIFFFTFWIIYGAVTLLWSIAPSQSIKELIYLSINFIAFFEVLIIANYAVQPHESIMKGWLLLFLLTLPIAIYELNFDVHLPMAVQDEGLKMNFGNNIVIERKFASVTFGNLNGYNTMIMYMFPFIMGFLCKIKNKVYIALLWLVVITLIYVVLLNGSRGGVLCLCFGIAIYAAYNMKSKKSILFFLFLIFALILFAFIQFSELFDIIINRFDSQGFGDDGRADIWKSSIDALVNTGFFGVGAGNFIPIMDSVYHLELTAPHNFFLEIGTQYGVIILIMAIGLLIKLLRSVRSSIKLYSRFIVICSLMLFPMVTTIDSGYVLGVNIWLFLASLLIISDQQLICNIDNG